MIFDKSQCREVYIECGVFLGQTIRQAAKSFEVCHGIEVVPKIYHELCLGIEIESVLRKELGKIYLHLGNSVDVLPDIIDPTKKTTFFLDSHFTAANSATAPVKEITGTECPLLDELKVITSFDWSAPHMIFVDDWRMFKGEFWIEDKKRKNYHREDWPTLEKIKNVMADYEYIDGDITGVFTYHGE